MSDSENKEKDFLEVDDQIGGQNYVCLSFISPESLIQDKSAFNCAKFLQSYCKEQKLKFDDIYNKYKDFVYKYEDELQRDFDENNNFQTSLRGIKVRGVFDTREAAEGHAKKLSIKDTSFHVFIGQMGYWLPWDPNADKVQDEVFQNSELNKMMDQYQQNTVNKDMFYEEQKREKIKEAREEAAKAKMEKEKNKEDTVYEIVNSEPEPEPEPEVSDEPVPDGTVPDEPVSEESETKSDLKAETIDEDLKTTLEGKDPWLQNKEESILKE